eukprot:g37070.t1
MPFVSDGALRETKMTHNPKHVEQIGPTSGTSALCLTACHTEVSPVKHVNSKPSPQRPISVPPSPSPSSSHSSASSPPGSAPCRPPLFGPTNTMVGNFYLVFEGFLGLLQNVRERLAMDFRSLAAFRIMLGLSMLSMCYTSSQDVFLLYSDDAPPHMSLLPRDRNWRPGTGQGLFSIHNLSGYRTPQVSCLSWLLKCSADNRIAVAISVEDTLCKVLLWWAIFLPVDEVWAWKGGKWLSARKVLAERQRGWANGNKVTASDTITGALAAISGALAGGPLCNPTGQFHNPTRFRAKRQLFPQSQPAADNHVEHVPSTESQPGLRMLPRDAAQLHNHNHHHHVAAAAEGEVVENVGEDLQEEDRDARGNLQEDQASLASLAFALQMFFLYWSSAMLKQGQDWEDGTAGWYTLRHNSMVKPIVISFILPYVPDSILRYGTWASRYLQLYASFLFICPIHAPFCRRVAANLFAAFQLFCAFFLRLHVRPWLLVGASCAFLPGDAWQGLALFLKQMHLPRLANCVDPTASVGVSNVCERCPAPTGRGGARGWFSSCLLLFSIANVSVWTLARVGYTSAACGKSWEGLAEGLGWKQDWRTFLPHDAGRNGWWILLGHVDVESNSVISNTTVDLFEFAQADPLAWPGQLDKNGIRGHRSWPTQQAALTSLASEQAISHKIKNTRALVYLQKLWDSDVRTRREEREHFADHICSKWQNAQAKYGATAYPSLQEISVWWMELPHLHAKHIPPGSSLPSVLGPVGSWRYNCQHQMYKEGSNGLNAQRPSVPMVSPVAPPQEQQQTSLYTVLQQSAEDSLYATATSLSKRFVLKRPGEGLSTLEAFLSAYTGVNHHDAQESASPYRLYFKQHSQAKRSATLSKPQETYDGYSEE